MTRLEDSPDLGTPRPRALDGSLGATAIVFMVVAAASPLTVIGGAAPLGILLGNGVGFPSMFVVSGVILLLFSVGISAVARHVPKPGAFFTYVGYGLGRPMGLASAWLALLTYTAIQVSVYGYIGFVLSFTIAGLGGPAVPWYAYTLVVVVVVGLLGYRRIELSSKVLAVLLTLEVGIVLAMVVAVVITGGAEGLSGAPFVPSIALSGSPGIGLMFAIAAFIGFEATAIFRDEARDPGRTIPRATYAAVIGIGVFYTLASWGLVMAWGPSTVVDVAGADPGAMIIVTMARYLGSVGEVAVNILLITAMFACVLSFHNVITRYQHSMANAGVLPDRLGQVHSSHLSPHVSSLVQTITAGALTVLFAVFNLDPLLNVFTWFAGVATLAIVVLMALASAAVIAYFARTRADRRLWHTVIAPTLGLLGLVGCAVVIASNFPLLVGDVGADGSQTFGWLSSLLLLLIVAFPAFGFGQAMWINRRHPAAYQKLTDAIAG